MVLARTRERLAMKIRSKLIVSPHRHFTEQLVGTFEKSPWKSNLTHESSSFFIRQLKNDTGFTLQQSPLKPMQIDEPVHQQLERPTPYMSGGA
jgi:hypothetical protein